MNRTTFSFRIDRWDHDGNTIMDHVAGVENLIIAHGRLRGGLPALARRNHNSSPRCQDYRGQPQRGPGLARCEYDNTSLGQRRPPVVRIWSPDDPKRYVELQFESQQAASTRLSN